MNGRQAPGRVRWRLAELLSAKGLIVSPYDLWGQQGGYRGAKWDLACWGSNDATWRDGKAPDGSACRAKVMICSWSTMSECVRRGVSVGKFGTDNGWGCVAVESL